MSENGQGKKSLVGEAFELIDDHLELASLEWEYEKAQSLRRLGGLAGVAVMVLSAFALLQVAAVYGLVHFGLSVGFACLALAGVYVAIAVFLFWKFGRRDPRAGEPFQGTRQELHYNLKWIRQFFS